MNTNNELIEGIIETVEMIVIDYDIFSRRENANRVAFREEVMKHLTSLIAQRESTREKELVEAIEKMKKLGKFEPYTDERYEQDSYNQAIDEITALIKGNNK